ncbi:MULTISPECIES: DNA-deoxyinosine glycosylase [unclassified Enterococcus]|uniref:DNA-deoxyinosine glycosylase n=1 Tax=unclassified Enterococcus TaxID=2608891 RepID=UPI00155226C4|nr:MULTISPECIES: DNA-deoxyinosine glycosylase [unclassified Enterococcus]MBS7577129.1 DNA-deoxyinosine glycosylase [Enterococcus sp. MMGLQ5-2]MBS7584424.1 DNA-deoxyinosine glycosylase [Enterococcus sp. MMGLQ5-1]NPD12279.1 DNA-deoxyinosine glycosylase [Enterococcus sp. MMGLQ5-1]NPD36963.1 DNA-deoxyinosine glycosylase [Enterococcus sp. MMGLQ5-2]
MHEGLQPIYNQSTEILILGSAPSQKSIEFQQYYGNPSNQFWKIIFQILAIDDPITYQKRIDTLLKQHIGLWDVYQRFERIGSLDVNFTSVELNHFDEILEKAPIKKIITNGKRAYQEAQKINEFKYSQLAIIPVPSTSGANNGKGLARMEAWRKAIKNNHY